MACQYFVGGRWVSENEFKALLNEGLLDTLVANNKLSLKGFKVDSSKVKLPQEKSVITRTSVPAVKLAEILAKEIKARQEYPLNMLSALELNEDLTDFKIPLWASPEAAKFESLLTSLVSNKVVKQKMNGGSSVLGSEEGFRIKEGDDAAGDLKNSGITFTSKFDPTKGLQPLRVDSKTGKILPAQIMIPFKFRNERGEILDMKEFITVGEDGRQMLDTDKIPDKLLQLFGFRIPTQERNSMAAVEIVGFLPEAMGDLMLAPRDFTKQMGSDFDVDKLYTYMYNHFYLNGKLYTNFLTDPKKIETQLAIAKESLQELKDALKLSKEEAKILNDYIKNTIDSAAENEEGNKTLAEQANEIINKAKGLDRNALNTLIDRISVLNRSFVAARQNKILDIHLDIMTSSNPEVIASIIARDSFGEFSNLATEVNEIRSEKGANPRPLTILSDIYQRTKYINATAGKNGVGSFSLDSTFNAVAQGKDLVLQNLDEETHEDLFGTPMAPKTPTAAQVLAANQDVAVFGNVVSKGDLSNKYTLRSQQIIAKAKAENRELTKEEKESLKFKSTIIRALQSTAVDNEKEQILDKLNINDETFSAIRAMALLGFEEEDIAGLITQDIIWEYLAKVRANRSSLSKYNPNFEQELKEELTKKYDPDGLIAKASETQLVTYKKLADISGEDLIKNLETSIDFSKSTDASIRQLMLLEKFQSLDNIGAEIVKVQSAINSESKGVPKSLLETSTKVTQGKNLKFSPIFNADRLLGNTDAEGNFTPTSINGYAFKYGTEFADNIYAKYFPYKKPGFDAVIREVLKHMANGDSITNSMSRLNETTSEISNDIRSYFYSNQDTNLFLGNPDEEARRLFIDVEGKNLSLASILQALSSQPWYSKNQFLNKLTFNINTNGTVSRINFEASTAANFDERSIYDGFAYLLSKNVPLGEFNGIQYTSRTLAQDLVTAAFLEGGNQGAKQYLRYVPVAYLKTLGFGEYLGAINFDFVGTFEGNLDGNGQVIYSMPSAFTRQYIQNNPEIVKTVDLSDTGSKTIPDKFKLLPKSLEANFVEITDPATGEITKTQTHFLSIRDPKANSKYALYEFNETTREYERIPVLKGTYGFTQYNSQTTLVSPIQKQEKVKPAKQEVAAPGYSIKDEPVQPTKTFNANVVNNTAPVTKPNLLGANTNLTGKEALDDLISRLLQDKSLNKLNYLLLDRLSSLVLPEGFKFEYTKLAGIRGRYNYDTRTLTVNLNHEKHKDINDIAETVAHELIHAFTGESIKNYQEGKLDKLSAEEIAAIDSLEALRMSYLNYLAETGSKEELQKFMDNFKAWVNSDPATRKAFASEEEISKYYGGIKLSEFVTMAMSNPGFQAYLNKVKVNDKSIMTQIKELLLDLLNAMGLDIQPGSLLASAVKNSMDLIDAGQLKQISEDVFYTTEEVEAMRKAQQPVELAETKTAKPIATPIISANVPQNKVSGVESFGSTVIANDEVIKALGPNPHSIDMIEAGFRTRTTRSKSEMDNYALKVGDIIKHFGKSADGTTKNILAKVTAIHPKGTPGFKGTWTKEGWRASDVNVIDKFKDGAAAIEFEVINATEPAPTTTEFTYKDKTIPTEFVLTAGQDNALKRLVDFVNSDEKFITLQGAAGTGKTAVIGYLQKYFANTGATFVYMAPTHAATAELAFATVKSGNKNLPMTVQSAFAKKKDPNTGKELVGPTKKLADKLGYTDNIIVIDEVSMLSAKDYATIKEAVQNREIQVIFMGDIKQIPEVDVSNPETKQVSKAFTDNEQVELTEVKRTESEGILSVLTELREKQSPTIPRIQNTEEIKYLDGTDYVKELVSTVTEDPENTVVIAYTNNAVSSANSKIRKLLGRSGDPQQNDIIVGYLGYSSKQIENKDIANSIRYTIDEVEKKGSEYYITASSQKLGKLAELGVGSVSATATGRYLQLSDTDAFKFEDLTAEDFDKNNATVSEVLAKVYRAKQEALRNPRMWSNYYAAQGDAARFFAKVLLGGDYIYNPSTNRMEKYDYARHANIKRANADLYVEKGVDYGHAVTIHKSQGSTVKNVFFDAASLPKGSSAKLMQGTKLVGSETQSLIYVGMSRASDKLVVNADDATKFRSLGGSGKITLNFGANVDTDQFRQPFDPGFSDRENNGPSNDDWDAYNAMRANDEILAARELDEDMYQKYLLICGK